MYPPCVPAQLVTRRPLPLSSTCKSDLPRLQCRNVKKIRGLNLPGTPWATSACHGGPLLYFLLLKPKSGKDPKEVQSYRPISLLPIIAKLLEKLILRRTDPDFSTSDWMAHHELGFRQAHSTIQHCHRVTHTILKALNNKENCTSVFLDVSQAFDRVWHPGLLYKIKKHLPSFFPPLQSHLSDRQIRTRVTREVSPLFPINSGVLEPMLYLLFTSGLPQAPNITIGAFADDTVILTCHNDILRASSCLQEYLL